MAAVLELIQITKRFAGPGGSVQVAVDHLNLAVAGGEFFSLLGASGCGKTTVLRIVAGFERADQGELRLKGQVMNRTPPYERPVNTVFQSYALFEHMSVCENIAFGLEMERLAGGEIRRRVDEVLNLVQLESFANRRPRQLSGGQRQRVALARALVKRPAVLLLDEPLSALDLQLRRQVQLELKQIQRQTGIAFVFVTHDQEEALTLSDRIGVMDRGRLLQVATPVEIYERPSCRFVAEFVGEINLFAGIVDSVDPDGSVVEVPALGTHLRSTDRLGLACGQTVTVCIRPERCALTLPGAQNLTGNKLAGTLIDTTYIGASTRQLVDLGRGNRLKVLQQNRDSLGLCPSGSAVEITVFAPDVRVLPEEPP